uniref:Uncharacterized protein n=1 Tax=Anguilla anguilla TaxID=7936 RepID=A0A0E9VJL7_ANGAN
MYTGKFTSSSLLTKDCLISSLIASFSKQNLFLYFTAIILVLCAHTSCIYPSSHKLMQKCLRLA